MGIQLAKIVTKQTVVALDVDPAKLKLAKEYGADFAVRTQHFNKWQPVDRVLVHPVLNLRC